MKRLVDREFSRGTLEATAADLLQTALPYRAPGGAKARVRARLLATQTRRRSWEAPVALAALVLLGVGIAGAVVGRWRQPAPNQAPPVEATHNVGSHPVLVPAPSVTRVPDPARAASSRSAATDAAPAVSTLRQPRQSRPTASGGEDADEAALLYGAARSLRRDSDAQGAERALDEYFAKYPNGALGEEALALAIEASLARRDGRAPALARQYLARYPDGPFRKQAERALRSK